MKKKCIVLFSGGLDSRLVVKIMQEKGFEVIAAYFKLPFSCSCYSDVEEFLKTHKVTLKVFDCTRDEKPSASSSKRGQTKGKLFKDYLKVIKKAEHGRGVGYNPCVDCKIFMFKNARKFGKENGIDVFVTGEVVGQRPMSQQEKQMKIIEEKSGLKNKIVRPLGDLGISGRQRVKQMALAKKFKIKYPHPAGGCLLCEKFLKKRFEKLFERGLTEEEVLLINVGRHFIFDTQGGYENPRAGKCWVVIGRNQVENEMLEKIEVGEFIEPSFIGPSARILDLPRPALPKKKIIEKVNDLIKTYSKQGSLKDRKKFERFKI